METESSVGEKQSIVRPLTHEKGALLMALLDRRIAYDDQTCDVDADGNLVYMNEDRATGSQLGVTLSAETHKYTHMTYMPGNTGSGIREPHGQLFDSHTEVTTSERPISWLSTIARAID